MKNQLNRLLIALALCASLHRAAAQDTAFSYQGLLNAGGRPANGSYDLSFTLYASSNSGMVIAGPVTCSAVGVTNGSFTTLIDFGSGGFNNGANSLELAVRATGGGAFTTLAPRQLLTSVPFAIVANGVSGLVSASQITGTLPAGQLSGVIPSAQLPTTVVTNGAGNVNLTGQFSGNGSGLTNLNASSLIGTVADGQLSTNVALLNVPSGSVATGSVGTMAGIIVGATVTSGGSGYTTSPMVTVSGVGGGMGAQVTAVISGGQVIGLTVVHGGSGYGPMTQLIIAPPTASGSQAFASATYLTNARNIFVGDGSGLSNLNAASLTGALPAGSVAAGSLTGTVADGQLSSNVALLNVPSGSVATGSVVTMAGIIVGATVTSGGSGYTMPPLVTVSGVGGGMGAQVTAVIAGGQVTALTVVNGGGNYPPTAQLIIAPPTTTGSQTFLSATYLTNTSNVFAGNGSGLSNLNASNLVGTLPAGQLSGVIPSAQLPTTVVTNGAGNVNLTGKFSGDGGGLTNLNAASLTGTMADGQLSSNVALLNVPSGSVATGSVATMAGMIVSATVTSGGSGYTTPPLVTVSGVTGGMGAQVTAVISGGQVTALTVVSGGGGYGPMTPLIIAPPTASGSETFASPTYLTNTSNVFVGNASGLTHLNASSLIGTVPAGSVVASSLTGTVPDAQLSTNVALLNVPTGAVAVGFAVDSAGVITNVIVISGGSGYVTPPTVTVEDPLEGGTGAVVTAMISGGQVTGFTVLNGGSGYGMGTIVNIAPPTTTGGSQTFASATYLTNTGNVFVGDGSGLSNLYIGNLAGLTIQLNPTSQFFPNNGAANIIAGSGNSVANYVVGATISGGGATNYNFVVLPNIVTADFGTVGGGALNTAFYFATVGGGYDNTSLGTYATIGGGSDNIAYGNFSVAVGGIANNAGGNLSVVAGGNFNYAPAPGATISGGETNEAGGIDSTVPGGNGNNALGNSSFAAGNQAQAVNDGSFVWADFSGTPFGSTTANQFSVRANGGVQFVTGGAGMTIDGQTVLTSGSGSGQNSSGAPNIVEGATINSVAAGVVGATISGGGATNFSGYYYANSVYGDFGTVGGGAENSASGFATVGGGQYNSAVAGDATVGGGQGNGAGGDGATIGGGEVNSAGGEDATVGGGSDNSAGGEAATVPGGFDNTAAGDYSFAAGYEAQALDDNSFVWSDGAQHQNSQGANSFTALATGGVYFYSSLTGGVQLAPNGAAWTSISDRNAKKNIVSVDYLAVLDKLDKVPVEQWNYKWEKDSDVPNIGPMAQDFKEAFYPGRDDKGITTLEFDGVELAAIKGLNAKLEATEKSLREKDATFQQQETELHNQSAEIADLQSRLKTLEQSFSNKKSN